MNPIVGVIGYKLIMGVVIGLLIAGIILLAKNASCNKSSNAYIFEQFAPQGDTPQGELIQKLRDAIALFQKDLLLIRICARETCNVNKVLEDLFAKKLATLDKDLTDMPAEMKTKWEKYRTAGAERAFKQYMNDYSWTHNHVKLLECFAGDELTDLVQQINIAGHSKEFKEAVNLFIIIKNTLKFNELFISEMKQGSDAIKSALKDIASKEGFANKVSTKQLNEIAQSQLEKLGQFHDAVTEMKKEVDTQKETLIDIVKTFSEVAPPSTS